MSETQPDPSKVTALYPDPPPFWKAFTDENIARLDALKQQYAVQHGLDVDTIIRIPDVPDDLTYLQPPAEPADLKWKVFDELQTVGLGGSIRISTSMSKLTALSCSSTMNS